MTAVSVYFDGGVFSDGVRGQGLSMDMDLKAFAASLVNDGDLADVYYIAPVIPASPYPNKHANQQALFERLRGEGLEVYGVEPKIVGSIFVDAGVETLLATKLLTDAAADRFDRALVVSNRGALAPAVEAVRATGKPVEVAFFDYTVAPGNALDPEFRVIAAAEVLALTRGGARPPAWG